MSWTGCYALSIYVTSYYSFNLLLLQFPTSHLSNSRQLAVNNLDINERMTLALCVGDGVYAIMLHVSFLISQEAFFAYQMQRPSDAVSDIGLEDLKVLCIPYRSELSLCLYPKELPWCVAAMT